MSFAAPAAISVLVTGGGGFLGTAICRQLARLGHRVTAFQRSEAAHLQPLGVRSLQGDVTDPAAVGRAVAGCDAVVHTAALAGIWGSPADYRRINVEGTALVLRACRESGVGCLVYTSSPSIVHSGGDIGGADESLPAADRFHAPYPATKAEAEAMVLAANGDELRTVALRPHLIWGPGDPHILPRLAEKARGGSLALPGPDKLIDTIFVDNAADAHVLALQELAGAARCAGKPYFVTNNEPMPQGEIIRRLLAAIGIEVRIRAVPVGLAIAAGAVCETVWRALGIRSDPPVTRFAVEQLATAHWFDTRAAERDFGYRPRITIAEGLELLAKSAVSAGESGRPGGR
jgi:nucleoside-diphosphate-sugar epimerase